MINKILITFLILVCYHIYITQGHADESPYCTADLESINTRTHTNDEIKDTTGGFTLTIEPKPKKLTGFSPDFTITLDSTKYKTIRGLLLYVEHENQTTVEDEEEYNKRLGYFIDINDQYFRPKKCGIKSLPNSTLEHFNREDKPLPQKFSWTLKNVFDYENDFYGVIKAIAVVSMKEWGVPEPTKFQPKNLMQEIYPEEYKTYLYLNTPSFKKEIKKYYSENPFLFVLITSLAIVTCYFLYRFIIKRIKLYKRQKKYENYYRLETINKVQTQIKDV
ncbi:hypothetical protein BCR32DRAFT_293920 [Anaeromyces robustus]|uniref:Reelin domain-containing protein n=1 Tax=Anaeromyces robustus TaxID=1754192 RepID=A0A1Y1X369_9FUNG|nr:hypothetical protein BCR32DRAFT_293920 [Anaeromyces robustus]|eukprot:ORX80260.1 hypothetical protein BCR32DRAFT_293920 [Anaeromyces robustus]